MNLAEIEDKRVAMIVWNTEKEDDVRVYLGKLENVNGEYAFINEEKGWKVSLENEQLSHLHPVTEDLREMLLNADYALSMSMSSLPETYDTNNYKQTGINWSNNL